MPTIQTIYEGKLRTRATHVQSGNSLLTDAPTDNNGKGEAFSPTDLVCTALGSCMMTIMGMVADRNNIDLRDTRFDIIKSMAANPRKISKIEIVFYIKSKEKLTPEQQEKLKRAALTCPVALSLHPDIEQVVTFNF